MTGLLLPPNNVRFGGRNSSVRDVSICSSLAVAAGVSVTRLGGVHIRLEFCKLEYVFWN